MLFKKKELSLEEQNLKLEENVYKAYDEFRSYGHLAHYSSYHQFKMSLHTDLQKNLPILREIENPIIKHSVLSHFKEQLKFVNKNPFSADSFEYNQFLEKNYPYDKKLSAVIDEAFIETKKETHQNTQKLKI